MLILFKRSFFRRKYFEVNLRIKTCSGGVWEHAPPEKLGKFAYYNGHFSAFGTIFKANFVDIFCPLL